MITLQGLERVSLLSVWMLNPNLGEFLAILRNKGYITAKVKPRSGGGYDIAFLEPPNVIAIKGSTYLMYDPGRRSLMVDGATPDEMLLAFNEVENLLREVGSDPDKCVLFYEFLAKASAVANKLYLGPLETSDILGFNVIMLPITIVSENGDPNSTNWFHMDIRPMWTSWKDNKIRYEITLIYRNEKSILIKFAKTLENNLKKLLDRISIFLSRH